MKSNKSDITDTFYLIILKGVNYLLPLVVMPYLLYVLQPKGYGYVGFSYSFIQYFTLFVDFGFNLSGTKRIAQARDKEYRDRIFSNIATAKLLLLVASTALILVLLLTIKDFQAYQTAIWATWPMTAGSALTYMFLFQGIGKIRIFSIINTISKVICLPLIFILVKHEGDYIKAAFLQSIVFVFAAIISDSYIIKKHLASFKKASWPGIKDELSNSFPLFLSTASTSAYTQLFVIILGFYCTTTTIGYYTSADRVVRALVFLFYVPINQVFFPKVSSLSVADRLRAIHLFTRLRNCTFAVMLLLSVCIFAGAPLVPTLLGAKYIGAVIYIRILSIIPLFVGLGGIYGQMGLVALGNSTTVKAFRNVYIAVAVFSILAAIASAPYFRSVGICALAALSEILVAILMFINCKKYEIA